MFARLVGKLKMMLHNPTAVSIPAKAVRPEDNVSRMGTVLIGRRSLVC